MGEAGTAGEAAHAPRGLLWWTCEALALVLLLLLVVELTLRVGFRCDFLIWSESSFMTNILKLANGRPVYSLPSELNSYIYSDGLECLTYALLAPLGLVLDVRFCRAINVLIGFAAALCIGTIVERIDAELRGGRRSLRLLVFGSCVGALIVFSSPTSEGLHPDNLHILHAVLSLLLCTQALRRESLLLAAVALGVAGLGVLAKQPAAMAPLGALVALLAGRRWAPRGIFVLIVTGLLGGGFVLWFLLGDPNRRFFLVEVPAAQPIFFSKLPHLLSSVFQGHRLLLATMTPVSVVLLRERGTVGRQLLLAWGAVGMAEVAPNAIAFLKFGGAGNDLTIFGVWLLLLNGPTFWHLAGSIPARAPAVLGGSLLLGVLLFLIPTRPPPSKEAVRYCDQLVGAVGADVGAGRRVLLSNGTAPLIANGLTAVPLDRGAIVGELWSARMIEAMTALKDRLAAGHYDRLYLAGRWLQTQLAAPPPGYVFVGDIPAPAPRPTTTWLDGFRSPDTRFMLQMEPVKIYERQPAKTSSTPTGAR